mmetsp:Transcript_26849/g.42417  ORF Transcript_26849/g.42417 Transcript_26849/m.42417 type:complete len:234 (+) Transcript_26849:237-938(+)
MVSHKPLLKSCGSIIRSLHQRLSSFIILHALWHRIALRVLLHCFRGSKLHMVTTSALLVNPTSTDSLLQHRVRNLQFNDLGHARSLLAQHLIQSLRLHQRAGETVQDESEFAVGFADAIPDDADDDVVGDESSSLHDGGGLETDLRFGGDGGAKHVARGELGDAEEILDFRAVRSLSSAWWTKKDHNISRPVGGKFILYFLRLLIGIEETLRSILVCHLLLRGEGLLHKTPTT